MDITNTFICGCYNYFSKKAFSETIINCSLFWSLSDKHHSIYMHRDEETVLLIQGVGEVAYALSNEEASKNSLIQMKTGDALLLEKLKDAVGPRFEKSE